MTAGESASTSVPPAPGTMATDSWALAVDEQEAAAESVSCLQLQKGQRASFGWGSGLWERTLPGLVRAGAGCGWGWSLDSELALFTHPLPRLRKRG